MAAISGSLLFWTVDSNVVCKDIDFGVSKYEGKSSIGKEREYYEDKKKYVESRGGIVVPKNSRHHKLQDGLQELELALSQEKVIWESWRSSITYQVVVQNGLLITLVINPVTGDLLTVDLDKYLIGKLLPEYVVDVGLCQQYMLFSYNECRLTVVHSSRSYKEGQVPLERLSSLNPRVQTVDSAGPSGRRFERKLSCNAAGDMAVVWWATSQDEMYPWSPLSQEQDRANVLVYSLSGEGAGCQLMCYCHTEMTPLGITFSQCQPDLLLTVEQRIEEKGSGARAGVTLLLCKYEVDKCALHRRSTTLIALEAPVIAHAFSPKEDRLVIACSNGMLAVHSEVREMAHVTLAGMTMDFLTWHPGGSLIAVGNRQGQVQCFDAALMLIRLQINDEESSPTNRLDFQEYFTHQRSLCALSFAPLEGNEGSVTGNPQFLLARFTKGPLVLFRVCSTDGEWTKGALVAHYLSHGQVEEATNLLISLCWDREGSEAMLCLSLISNHVLRNPLNSQSEGLLSAALASFFSPIQAIGSSAEEEFGAAVRCMARRYVFLLIRLGHLTQAFTLALDLKDSDCFFAIHRVASKTGEVALASLALERMDELSSEDDMPRGGRDRRNVPSSSGSCSSCSSESVTAEEEDSCHGNGDYCTIHMV